MPRDFVDLNTDLYYARQLRDLRDLIKQTLDQAEFVKGVMDHNTDGSVWTDLESLFGLAAGEGEVAYNLVAGTLAGMKGTAQTGDAVTLSERIG